MDSFSVKASSPGGISHPQKIQLPKQQHTHTSLEAAEQSLLFQLCYWTALLLNSLSPIPNMSIEAGMFDQEFPVPTAISLPPAPSTKNQISAEVRMLDSTSCLVSSARNI